MLEPRFEAECEAVARLLGSPDAVPWLTDYFVYWAAPLASEWSVKELQLPKAEMKEQLARVVDAADGLNEALSQPIPKAFLERTHGIAVDKIFSGFQESLLSIRRYAYLAAKSSALSDEAGNTRRGRGKTPVPGGLDPMDFCALIIAEAWKFVRGTYPGARNRDAAKTALSFWEVSVGTVVGWQGGGFSAWRQHFENAHSPEFASSRAECLRILRAVKCRA